MATKINTEYYGAENTWITNTSTGTAGQIKTSPYTISELVRNGTYTGGDFEHTASPWGVGESSISSMWHGVLAKDGGKLVKRQYRNDRGNTPLYLYENSDGSNAYDLGGGEDYAVQANITCRISPAVTVPELQGVNSTLTIDNNTNVACCGIRTARPITYYNYQDARLLIDVVWFVRENGSLSSIEHAYVADLLVNPQNYRNIKYVLGCTLQGRFKYGTQGTLPSYGNYNAFCPSVGGNALKIPDVYKKSYYGDEYDTYTRPQRRHMTLGYWRLSTRWSTSTMGNASDFPTIATVETLSATPYSNNMFTPFGQMSEKNQVFDDVSYHWKYDVAYAQGTPYVSGLTFIEDGDTLPNLNVNYYTFCHLEIDDSTYDEPALAYVYALIHEAAFMGFPVIVNVYDSTYPLNWDWIFLPEFDEHLITTGDFVKASQGSDLVNYSWGDVFGQTMPDYDPEYEPPKPEPEEKDRGDLTNRIPSRFAVGGLGLYVTNYQTLYSLQQFLNGTYAPTPEALAADFKGTNPQDYIISIQKYPTDTLLPTSATQSDIYIGKIDSTFDAYKLSAETQGTHLGHFTFGELKLGSSQIPIFGDFRDYQSKITLLMPFVGTAELDPRLYVGHSIGLDYVVDYLTGSVAAEIKRDGLTVETKTSKLSITVPFLAGNMGQYQNQLAQLGMSIEQSKIKQITGAVTSVFSIGGAAATVAGGGSELAGLGSGAGIIRGASNMLIERINQESLEYQLEHTQPSIGTISTASPGNAFEMDDRARLLIWRPYMLPGYDRETYSHVVGNATLRAAALSEFSGYTVAAAAELSNVYTIDGTKSASEQELKLIKQALLAGVYV